MSQLSDIDYFLSCLTEESGEVSLAVGKALRFGIIDKNPNTKNTNWTDIRQEVHDVLAVFELLCDSFDRVSDIDRNLIDNKKRKVIKNLNLSAANKRISKHSKFINRSES